MNASLDAVVAVLGRLHLVVLHFPLALLVVAGALALRPTTAAAAATCLRLGAAAAVVTVATGLLHAGEVVDGDAALDRHRLAGIAAGVVAVLAALAWRRLAASRALAVLAGVVVVVAGHQGAVVARGEGYLLRPLRQDDVVAVTSTPSEVGAPSATPDADTVRERYPEGEVVDTPDFNAHIRPLLERSCLRCHGPEKRKGGLRLDQKRFALKGGESGPVAIVPGSAATSLVYTACAAADDDEGIMPPRGRLLARSEAETLKRWIDQGAAWPEPASTPP